MINFMFWYKTWYAVIDQFEIVKYDVNHRILKIFLCPPLEIPVKGYIFVWVDLSASACQFLSSVFLESVGRILPSLYGYIIGKSQRNY